MTFTELSQSFRLLRLSRVILLHRHGGSKSSIQACRFSTATVSRNHQQQRDDQLKVFKDNATKWWSGKEFSILRSMNEIRVPFIVSGLGPKLMSEVKMLDVGCGGGILSEPLARLGANVLGIDPVFESINQAQLHSQNDLELTERLRYRNCNIEDLSSQQEHIETYDAVVASEVLEHIQDVENFLFHCAKVLKPNGSLFITTINQTPLSWLGVIFFGEYILQQLPKGTHTYDMFVSVKGLRIMLERLGFHIRLVNGFMYEPVGGNFYWTPTTLTHYALQAVKLDSTSTSKNMLNYEQRRHSPKAAKTKSPPKPKVPLDESEMTAVIPYDIYKLRADSIINDFREHLEKNLTTRATSSALETLKIGIEGLNEPLELRDIAQISMKGANLIMINLSSMPEAVKPAMKALHSLGNLSPQVEVNNIFVPIPRVTREHRENLVALARKAANNSKESLRALFSEFAGKAKRLKSGKNTGISVDLIHNAVENLQYDLNKRLLDIDAALERKVSLLLNEK